MEPFKSGFFHVVWYFWGSSMLLHESLFFITDSILLLDTFFFKKIRYDFFLNKVWLFRGDKISSQKAWVDSSQIGRPLKSLGLPSQGNQ